MNSRERFLACYRYQPTDHAPFLEIAAWGQTTQRWLREGMPGDVDTTFYVGGNEFFGFERWEYLPIGVAMIPGFEDEHIAEDERTVTYRGGDGIVRRTMKTGGVDGTTECMDQYLSFPVTDRESFEAMKQRYDPATPQRYPQPWADLARSYQGRDYPLALTQIGGFGLYSMLRSWMGTEAACTIFYDDPALAEEMLDFMTDFFVELTERALTDVDIDWYNYFEDFAGKGGPLVSPRIYRQFLMPRYLRINEHLRNHGVDVISLDSDGNIDALLPLIVEAGFTQISPLEQAAGTDMLAIRKEYGTALALMGGIDKRELAKGRKEIDAEVHRQAPQLLEGGGYVPTIDHSVPPDVSYDNWMYYLDVKRDLVFNGR